LRPGTTLALRMRRKSHRAGQACVVAHALWPDSEKWVARVPALAKPSLPPVARTHRVSWAAPVPCWDFLFFFMRQPGGTRARDAGSWAGLRHTPLPPSILALGQSSLRGWPRASRAYASSRARIAVCLLVVAAARVRTGFRCLAGWSWRHSTRHYQCVGESGFRCAPRAIHRLDSPTGCWSFQPTARGPFCFEVLALAIALMLAGLVQLAPPCDRLWLGGQVAGERPSRYRNEASLGAGYMAAVALAALASGVSPDHERRAGARLVSPGLAMHHRSLGSLHACALLANGAAQGAS